MANNTGGFVPTPPPPPPTGGGFVPTPPPPPPTGGVHLGTFIRALLAGDDAHHLRSDLTGVVRDFAPHSFGAELDQKNAGGMFDVDLSPHHFVAAHTWG